MQTKIKLISIFSTFILFSIMWLIGIILADIKFFILGLIIIALLIIVAFKDIEELKNYRDDKGHVMTDEREDIIDEKAANITFETIKALTMSIGIALLTLRDVYPQYIIIAYTLLSVGIICFIVKKIAIFYYKKTI